MPRLNNFNYVLLSVYVFPGTLIIINDGFFYTNGKNLIVLFQWQRTAGVSIYYFCIKWCISLFFVITSVVSVIQADTEEESQATTFIYLSRWGYTLCTMQSVVSVIMLTSALVTEKKQFEMKESTVVEKLYKFYWVLVEMATDVAFGITILFWSVQYNGS